MLHESCRVQTNVLPQFQSPKQLLGRDESVLKKYPKVPIADLPEHLRAALIGLCRIHVGLNRHSECVTFRSSFVRYIATPSELLALHRAGHLDKVGKAPCESKRECESTYRLKSLSVVWAIEYKRALKSD